MIGVGSIEKDFVVENESILTTSIFFVTGKTFEDGALLPPRTSTSEKNIFSVDSGDDEHFEIDSIEV